MTPMDVSPHELRDSEIPSAFRGYNPEVVDDLLERAAATIEGLQDKQRELTERLAAAEGALGDPRRAPAPAPVAAPPPAAPAPAPAPVAASTEDQMQEAVRALVLAQRTADETVSEAETRAREILAQAEGRQRQLLEEAEARLVDAEQRSQAAVADAQAAARQAGEAERARARAEVDALVSAREVLAGDIEALEQFASTYRDRLRAAIEAELAALEAGGEIGAGERPALSPVDIPAALDAGPPTQAVPAAAVDVPSPDAWSSFDDGPVGDEPTPSAFGDPGGFGAAAGFGDRAAFGESTFGEAGFGEPAPFGERVANPGYTEPAEESDFGSFPGFGGASDDAPRFDAPYGRDDEPVDAETLDDDAFFASLREAVSDDSPLGAPVDEADDDPFGSAFRRRQQ